MILHSSYHHVPTVSQGPLFFKLPGVCVCVCCLHHNTRSQWCHGLLRQLARFGSMMSLPSRWCDPLKNGLMIIHDLTKWSKNVYWLVSSGLKKGQWPQWTKWNISNPELKHLPKPLFLRYEKHVSCQQLFLQKVIIPYPLVSPRFLAARFVRFVSCKALIDRFLGSVGGPKSSAVSMALPLYFLANMKMEEHQAPGNSHGKQDAYKRVTFPSGT